jgi:glycosyltransferase involved in cell wall biosynthesis
VEKKPFFISVIIPVYNGEDFIAEAIDSILQQRYEPLEIIAVDDGSTDATPEIIARYDTAVRYIRQSNHGPASACNKGLSMAQGDIVGFLDADDLWTQNRLHLQLPYFTEDSKLDIVLGLVQLMRHSILPADSGSFIPVDTPEIALHPGCSLFKRKVFNTVGFFDETLTMGYDWDWFMRARELGITMTILEHTTLYYRRHAGNITNQVERGNHFTLEMLRKSIDRRRLKDEHGTANSLPDLRQFLKRS